MAFTAKDVALLRDQTGAGMMDCKKALVETDGDMEQAADYLRKRGVAVAAKKASRIASEGAVASFISKDNKVGALTELNCESDFVAKAEAFVEICNSAAKQVVEQNPSDLDAFLAQKSVDFDGSVLEYINSVTAKTGEKVSARRFERFTTDCGRIESYIHMGGKIGVLVEFKTGKDVNDSEAFTAMCHDVAMHIAAVSPKFVSSDEVPADVTLAEKEILSAQALNEGKPAAVVEKMIQGRIKKFFKEICLLEQEFVKNPDISVDALVAGVAKELGTEIKVIRFTRLVMGEGLEKKVDDLACEVAKMTQ